MKPVMPALHYIWMATRSPSSLLRLGHHQLITSYPPEWKAYAECLWGILVPLQVSVFPTTPNFKTTSTETERPNPRYPEIQRCLSIRSRVLCAQWCILDRSVANWTSAFVNIREEWSLQISTLLPSLNMHGLLAILWTGRMCLLLANRCSDFPSRLVNAIGSTTATQQRLWHSICHVWQCTGAILIPTSSFFCHLHYVMLLLSFSFLILLSPPDNPVCIFIDDGGCIAIEMYEF